MSDAEEVTTAEGSKVTVKDPIWPDGYFRLIRERDAARAQLEEARDLLREARRFIESGGPYPDEQALIERIDALTSGDNDPMTSGGAT